MSRRISILEVKLLAEALWAQVAQKQADVAQEADEQDTRDAEPASVLTPQIMQKMTRKLEARIALDRRSST